MSSKMKKYLSRRKKQSPGVDKPTVDQGDPARAPPETPQLGLQLLYDGTDANHPDVDFIAVPGMVGHPLYSFTDAGTGCCWLRDLLPSNAPHCRVFSYGYPADPFTKTPVFHYDRARELCQVLRMSPHQLAMTRRIIFICHSLGGLLLKRALIEAHTSRQFIDVFNRTLGILFFGTPHRGSSSADLAVTLSKIPRMVASAPQINRQNCLRLWHPIIKAIRTRFQQEFLVPASGSLRITGSWSGATVSTQDFSGSLRAPDAESLCCRDP